MMPAAAIFTATLREILGVRRLLLFGALAAFPGFVFAVGSSDERGATLLRSLIDNGVNIHFSLAVPVTALILSAAALGAERRDETLSFIVVRPIPRVTIAGAKLAAAFAAASALNAGGALILTGVYWARADEPGFVLPLIAGSMIATLVYCSVFVPLGYLSERSTLIGLAYVFVWENGVVGVLGVLGVTSPWRIGYTAFSSLAPVTLRIDDFVLSDLTPSAPTSLAEALLFAAASAALLTWILKRRDLV